MDVTSACRLPVASLVWQPNPSAWVLTVVCKATFLLRPGESPLAPDQEAPSQNDDHWGDDTGRSLRAAADLVPMKKRADVTLVGHAYAPNRQPARSLVARLTVGEINKSIEVYNDRAWSPEGALLEGQRFLRMPLSYERAAGGPETANPVGVRSDVRDAYGNIAVPNLQPPGVNVTSPQDVIETVSFGPIAPEWPSRRDRLGRHAGSWEARAWLRSPMPEDIDPGFFNAAPVDQQLTSLRDGERIGLENLHPEIASLSTTLAPVRLRALIEGRPTGPAPLVMQPDTLWIDSDRGLATLTFRGHVALNHPQERGRVVISQDRAIVAQEPPARSPESRPVVHTMIPGMSPQIGAALPFGSQGAPPSSSRLEEPRSPRAGLPFSESSIFRAPTLDVPAPAPAPAPAFVPPPMVRPTPDSAPARPGPSWVGEVRSPLAAEAPKTVGQLAARPPEVDASDLRAAAMVGVGAASTAAALRDARAVPTPEPSAPRSAPAVAARPVQRAERGELLELLWYDPECVRRARRKARWREILDALEQQPLDPDLDNPAHADEPMDIEDRRDVFEILARADATEADGLHDALLAGVRDDGKFVPQLVLATGDLVFPFDERLETLRATVTTVTPLIAGDENLKSTVDAAKDFLKTPDLLAAPAVAEGLTTRIKDAFAAGKRVVPQGYLEAQTERALLDQRHYQRRSIFKVRRIRAVLHLPTGGVQIPVYLPNDLAFSLPLYQRFGARLIAEVHVRADQYESQQLALRPLALMRVAPLPPPRK